MKLSHWVTWTVLPMSFLCFGTGEHFSCIALYAGSESSPISSKILICVQKMNIGLRVWNDMRVSNKDIAFIFGWTIPLMFQYYSYIIIHFSCVPICILKQIGTHLRGASITPPPPPPIQKDAKFRRRSFANLFTWHLRIYPKDFMTHSRYFARVKIRIDYHCVNTM